MILAQTKLSHECLIPSRLYSLKRERYDTFQSGNINANSFVRKKSSTSSDIKTETKKFVEDKVTYVFQFVMIGLAMYLLYNLAKFFYSSFDSLASWRKQDLQLINEDEAVVRMLGSNVEHIPNIGGDEANKIKSFYNERGFKAKSYSFGVGGSKAQTIVHVEREKEHSSVYKYRFIYIDTHKGPFYLFQKYDR